MATDMDPKISIVLPTFNEKPRVIDRCIESIRHQTLGDFECLVMDDSTEETSRARWARWQQDDLRIRHIPSLNRLGLARSLNTGIRLARGTLVARMDTDDLSQPERFTQQAAFLDQHTTIDIVGCGLTVVDQDDNFLGDRFYPAEHHEIAKRMAWSTGIAHPSVLVRRSAFDRFGFYNEDFRYAEDLELWLRWIRKGATFANILQPLLVFKHETRGRPHAHWQQNLRARLNNFGGDNLCHQVAGITFAALASCMPPPLLAKALISAHCSTASSRRESSQIQEHTK